MPTITITAFKYNSNFFLKGFFDSSGNLVANATSASSTQVVLSNSANNWTVTVDGSGFTYDSSGNPTGGTITRMTFKNGAGDVVAVVDVNWGAVDLFDALTAIATGDFSLLNALVAGNNFVIDGTSSTKGVDFGGGKLNDVFKGSDFNDLFAGLGGNDRMAGGKGNDQMVGGRGNDKMLGGSGKDLLSGDKGNDKMFGGGGKDQMVGGKGRDLMKGGGGDDFIMGGKGNDKMGGGGGSDTFFFQNGDGNDTIKDFAFGVDNIALQGVTAITDFNDLSNNHMAQVGADVVITYGANSITLENVNLGDLSASDFIF